MEPRFSDGQFSGLTPTPCSSPPLTVVRYTQYLTGKEQLPDLGICLEPTCVTVLCKAEGHRYKLINEEDFLGQHTQLLCSIVRTTRKRNSRRRKEMHPLKNKTEFTMTVRTPGDFPRNIFLLKRIEKSLFRTNYLVNLSIYACFRLG